MVADVCTKLEARTVMKYRCSVNERCENRFPNRGCVCM